MVTAVSGFIEQVGNMIKGIRKHTHPSKHYNSVKLQRASTNMRHAGQPIAWFPGAWNRRDRLVHTVRTVRAYAKSHGNLHTICYTKHALTKQSISDYLQSYALCEGVLKSKMLLLWQQRLVSPCLPGRLSFRRNGRHLSHRRDKPRLV